MCKFGFKPVLKCWIRSLCPFSPISLLLFPTFSISCISKADALPFVSTGKSDSSLRLLSRNSTFHGVLAQWWLVDWSNYLDRFWELTIELEHKTNSCQLLLALKLPVFSAEHCSYINSPSVCLLDVSDALPSPWKLKIEPCLSLSLLVKPQCCFTLWVSVRERTNSLSSWFNILLLATKVSTLRKKIFGSLVTSTRNCWMGNHAAESCQVISRIHVI